MPAAESQPVNPGHPDPILMAKSSRVDLVQWKCYDCNEFGGGGGVDGGWRPAVAHSEVNRHDVETVVTTTEVATMVLRHD